MASHRIVICERVSDIHTTIFLSIHLQPGKCYVIGLIQFSVFNSTFNITESNNKLYYYDNKKYKFSGSGGIYSPTLKTVPPGLYTLDTLEKAINDIIPQSTLRLVRINDNGYYFLHTTNICPVFTRPDSVLQVFGFPTDEAYLHTITTDDLTLKVLNTVLLETHHTVPPSLPRNRRDAVSQPEPSLAKNTEDSLLSQVSLETKKSIPTLSSSNPSTFPADISTSQSTPNIPNAVPEASSFYYQAPFAASLNRFKEMHITCPLVTNAYKNNSNLRVLHSFQLPPVSISQTTYIEVPHNVIYLPIAKHLQTIRDIILRLEDENSQLIDFGGEYVTIVLYICKLKDNCF